MMCPYADFLYDGNYACGLDNDFCDDPENPCDSVRDFIDFDDDDEPFEEGI
jgi:hypothetical protein